MRFGERIRSIELELPEWLVEKVEANDQRLTDDQFSRLKYYYKQLTGSKLKNGCQNCIPDAFIVLKIYLKTQNKNESSN